MLFGVSKTIGGHPMISEGLSRKSCWGLSLILLEGSPMKAGFIAEIKGGVSGKRWVYR